MTYFSPNSLQYALASGIGALIGLGAHIGIYIHGEWHIQAPLLFKSHLVIAAIALGGFQWYGSDHVLGNMFANVIIGLTSYLLAVFTSILTYRIVPGLHRLSKFPGPFLLKTSKLWHVWACRHSMNHFFLDSLHKKYGDFVRTGPTEITVFHPSAFAAIDGPDTECIKSEWYDLLHPDRALLTTRNRTIHDSRRRDWKQGFINRGLSRPSLPSSLCSPTLS